MSSEAVAEAARTGRIDRHGAALREAVALAAAVPGETEAFRLATALLLAEALRGGAADGLGWYLDAHADAYRHAPAPVRAAILNGYRVLHALDLGGIGHLPAPEARATRSQAEVEAGMAGVSPNVLKRLLRALDGGPAAETEALWRERAADLIAAPPVADAMRHLYETRDDWDPWRDWPEERIAREGVVIPFEAP